MSRKGLLTAGSTLLLCVLAFVPLGGVAQEDILAAQGNIQITLKKSFIEKYKDLVTIDVDDFVIDAAPKPPNAASKDGDMHAAGRADSIGLPIVAELMNAREQKDAIKQIHKREGKAEKVKISGVWRLWCEHGGTSRQVQGAPLEAFTSHNPPHVFEIHPITQIDGIDVADSVKPIEGFKPKDAHDAFVTYENVRCQIRSNADTVTLTSSMAGFNYVEFILELREEPVKLKDDGYSARCKVRDLQGELLVHNRRILFPKGTEPANKVKDLKKGKRMHVLGLPRIDLALTEWRVTHAEDEKWKAEEPLKWNLPYEVVVVGVYPMVAGVDD